MRGVDVHGAKGPIDWHKVKAAGYDFAFVKCSEGISFNDPRYHVNLADARRAGLHVGSYHFARPDHNQPEDEAHSFAAKLWLLPGDLLPALDFETAPHSASWALRFLLALGAKIGHKPIFYSYSSFIQGMAAPPALGGYPLWLANYRSTLPEVPKPWRYAAIWQHSSSGSVPGIGGHVDLNKLILPAIEPLLYKPAPKPLTPQPKRSGLWRNSVVDVGRTLVWDPARRMFTLLRRGG